MRQIVVGAGEVGRAVAEVLADAHPVTLRDIEGDPIQGAVLHVCFPWTEAFPDAVREYERIHGTGLTVIHSTVPVGTSRALNAVHSPVTGRHPNLAYSVRVFRKFVGGPRAREAAGIMEAAGIRTFVVRDQETTEAGKLWQTLQFGILVQLEKECRRFCEAHGADPVIAYDAMNRAYSEGYAAIAEPFRLPVLAHMDGPIGGHCVIPNARLTPSPVAAWLLERDKANG